MAAEGSDVWGCAGVGAEEAEGAQGSWLVRAGVGVSSIREGAPMGGRGPGSSKLYQLARGVGFGAALTCRCKRAV